MVDIDKWNGSQWQSLIMKLSMEDLTLLIDETKKLNSATRAMELLDRIHEFKVVKIMEYTVGILRTQCRMKMADAYDIKWGGNNKFREAMNIVKRIKVGMRIASSSIKGGTSLETLSRSFSRM